MSVIFDDPVPQVGCRRRGQYVHRLQPLVSLVDISNIGVPEPNRTGTRWIETSSTRPAAMYWRPRSAPPMTVTSWSPAAARAWSSALSMPSVTNEYTAPGGSSAGTVVRDHEHRPPGQPARAVRAPPRQRRVVRPSAADHGAQALTGLLEVAPVRLVTAERPVVQALAALAGRLLRRLVRRGDEAVQRHADVEDRPAHCLSSCQLRHRPVPASRASRRPPGGVSVLDHGSTTEPARTAPDRMGDHVVVEPTEISPREEEVLAALGEHLSNAQIAHRLHISVRTVESHVSSLLRKLGADDRRALAGLAARAAPPPAPAGRPAGIPASRTTFVGRSRDRDVALERLAQARLVTLLGPGGVGKTRLAAWSPRRPHPRTRPAGRSSTWCRSAPAPRPRPWPPRSASPNGPPRSLGTPSSNGCASGRSLLVLDNCEHLVDEVGAFVERVLSACPDTTSSPRAGSGSAVTGEHVAPVRPLPLDSDAERLFLDRAQRPSTRTSPPTAAMARGSAPGWTACRWRSSSPPPARPRSAPTACSRRWTSSCALLTRRPAGRRAAPLAARGHRLEPRPARRGRTDRCSAGCRCSCGGFDLAAARATTPGATRGEVADLVGRLVDKSLVVHGGAGPGRWRLLDTVRAYGAGAARRHGRGRRGPAAAPGVGGGHGGGADGADRRPTGSRSSTRSPTTCGRRWPARNRYRTPPPIGWPARWPI